MGIDIGSIIKTTITEGLKQAAENKNNSLEHKDVTKVATTVTAQVNKELTAVIVNQTNNEPLWKSRVLRGTIGAIVVIAATAFADWYADGVITTEAASGYVTAVLSAAYAVYGRMSTQAAPVI